MEIEGVIREIPITSFSFRPVELEAEKITVLGPSRNDFPSRCPPKAGPDIRITERHFLIRQPEFANITMLRSILVRAIRAYFEETNCIEIFPPSFVSNQCEGGATLFDLKYPDKDSGEITAYLTQSSQFYLEFLLPGIGDCFCIAPSFRKERSHTRRHATEFLHAECEWAGIITPEEHYSKLKYMLKGVITKFLLLGHRYLEELKLTGRVEKLLHMCDDIIILQHQDAIKYCRDHEIYKDIDTKTHFSIFDDIPEMQERAMIDSMDKIVFLVKIPKFFKSFYFKTFADDVLYVMG